MTENMGLRRRDLAIAASGLSLAAMAGATAAQAGGRDAPRRRIPADDRLDMIELMGRYAWAYDTMNAEALAATFTTDGVLEVFGRPLVTDRSGFAGFLATAAEMRKDRGWQHLTDHHIFADYDGTRCTVYSYYVMPEADPSGGDVDLRAIGYYISHCVRQGDGWLFARRQVLRWDGKQPF